MKRTVVFYRNLSMPSMLYSYILSDNDSVSALAVQAITKAEGEQHEAL